MQKILLLALKIFIGLPFMTALSADEILIGQTLNESGEFKKYAQAIKTGINTYLQRVNQAGGIKGKKISLQTYNDYGDAAKTTAAIAEMKKNGINLFLGCMGTRNVLQILPEAEKGDISLFFPWSGDATLHSAKTRHLINGPGLLQPQIDALAKYICDDLKIKQLAIMHADDTFSTTGANLLKEEITKRNLKTKNVESYNRRTLKLNAQCNALARAEPKAVICIGTSMPLVKLIKTFFTQALYTTQFFGIDSTFMAPEIIKDMGAQICYTAAVPNPSTSTLPIAKEFIEDLIAYDAKALPNVLSFTYYICTRILVEGLQKTSTPQQLIEYMEHLKHHSVGGFEVNFDPANRHLFGTTTYLIKD